MRLPLPESPRSHARPRTVPVAPLLRSTHSQEHKTLDSRVLPKALGLRACRRVDWPCCHFHSYLLILHLRWCLGYPPSSLYLISFLCKRNFSILTAPQGYLTWYCAGFSICRMSRSILCISMALLWISLRYSNRRTTNNYFLLNLVDV